MLDTQPLHNRLFLFFFVWYGFGSYLFDGRVTRDEQVKGKIMTPAIIILLGETNWRDGENTIVLHKGCDGHPTYMLKHIAMVYKKFCNLYKNQEDQKYMNINSLMALFIGNDISPFSNHTEIVHNNWITDYGYSYIYVIDINIKDISIYDADMNENHPIQEKRWVGNPLNKQGFSLNKRKDSYLDIKQWVDTTCIKPKQGTRQPLKEVKLKRSGIIRRR